MDKNQKQNQQGQNTKTDQKQNDISSKQNGQGNANDSPKKTKPDEGNDLNKGQNGSGKDQKEEKREFKTPDGKASLKGDKKVTETGTKLGSNHTSGKAGSSKL